MLDAWTPQNTNAKYPAFSTYYANDAGSFSTKYLFDNTFVRLRNVTLGYTLPRSLTSRFLVDNLRVYVQTDNPLTFGNSVRRGTDPEQSTYGGASNATIGTNNRLPTTKSISFGLQLSF
jgi:hypothetical protein